MSEVQEALGGYRELLPAGRVLGGAVLLATLLLAAGLERLQFQLRATEASTWWASNGRDVVNALAVLALTLALRASGFSGPIALCAAASLVVLLAGLQPWVERHRHATRWSVAVAMALGAPLLLLPRRAHGLFELALERLFPA